MGRTSNNLNPELVFIVLFASFHTPMNYILKSIRKLNILTKKQVYVRVSHVKFYIIRSYTIENYSVYDINFAHITSSVTIIYAY